MSIVPPIKHKIIHPTVGVEWLEKYKYGIIRLMGEDSAVERPVIRGVCFIDAGKMPNLAELKCLVMEDNDDELRTEEFNAVIVYLRHLELATKIRRLKKDGRVRVTVYNLSGTVVKYYE